MSNTTSSYLIDVSKKCIIPRAGKDANGLYWTAYGDVETKTLQGFNYSYVEDFQQASNLLEEDFEKLLSPVTLVIKGITSKIPVLKNIKIDNPKDLKNSALFLYSIYDSYVNTDTAGDPNKEDVKELADLFEKPYIYNLPMRKAAPSITFNPANSITINFAYGKCNLYNAYEEVYKPLTAIHKNLFPGIEASSDAGLGTVKYTYNIPYEQQSFVEMVKTIIGSSKENIQKVKLVDTADSAFQSLPKLQTVSNNLNDSDNDRLANVRIKGSKYYRVKNSEIYKTNISPAIIDAYPSKDEKDKILDEILVDANADSEDIKSAQQEKVADITKDILTDAINTGDATAANEKSVLVVPKGTVDISNSNMDWKLSIKKISEEEKTKNKSLKDTLADLVNLQPRAVGATLQRISDKIVDKQSDEIRLGFPPVYFTSLSDLQKALNEKESTYVVPKITMKSILFTKVTIGFNFDDTDEAGWPMSGQLKIENVWSLKYPNATISFNEDTNLDGLYSKQIINYNPDVDE